MAKQEIPHLDEMKEKWKKMPLPTKILIILIIIILIGAFMTITDNLAWLMI